MAYRTDENGKYVRTVRCSNCWESGHNKSKCPREKERYERAKLEDPDSWFVKNYERKKAERSKRACGYCREAGHTRRTCAYLKSDKVATIAKNKQWRQNVVEFFNNLGLGIGALVEMQRRRSWGDKPKQVVLITGINWGNLTFQPTHVRMRQALRVRAMKDFSREQAVGFPCDPAGIVNDVGTVSEGLHVKVLGRVSREAIEASVPAKWLTGAGPEVDDMFVDSYGKPAERYQVTWVDQ